MSQEVKFLAWSKALKPTPVLLLLSTQFQVLKSPQHISSPHPVKKMQDAAKLGSQAFIEEKSQPNPAVPCRTPNAEASGSDAAEAIA